jgi:hypothetical protein
MGENIMKKIWSILVISFLIIGSLGVVASKNKDNSKTDLIREATSSKISFSKVLFEQNNKEYLEVSLEGVSTYLMTPGEPMLPKVVKTIELPFGVKNVNVEVTLNNIKEQILTKEVKPAPAHLLLTQTSKTVSNEQVKDENIYKSTQPYPNTDYDYDVRCGLNDKLEHVTFVNIQVYPIQCIPAENKLFFAQDADIKVTYDQTNHDYFPENVEYDLLIISPQKFEKYLEPLVEHKNSFDVQTKLITTEEIYDSYKEGADKPEKIKYYIRDAIETWKITYVLLVGGLKNTIWATPRDDANQGTKGWYLPVRYNNLFDDPEHPLSEESIHDPGVITDLYYMDIFEEGGGFSSWDPNGDGIYAAWGKPGTENDIGIDMMPDVIVGRLACRSTQEVKDVVNKIIKYEETPADPSWFNRVLSISGDGFLDQEDLNFQWDTNGLEEGEYTIKMQSSFVDETEGLIEGPVDEINIKIDKDAETYITANHDDNLNPALQNGYPAPPISEIVTISNGNILGENDSVFSPDESIAYCNSFNGWANVSYIDGVLAIRGKSYNPRPYGVYTDVHCWVESENLGIVFEDWRNNTAMYFEGEWVVGNRELNGGGGALYYMDGFEKKYLWASNGGITGRQDLIDEFSKGYGFAFMSGHGSPNSWGDHFPGVPGNRKYGSFTGLTVTTLKLFSPFVTFPVYPMETLENYDKPSVTLIGGCHNSQFNVSMIAGILDILPYTFPNIFKPKSMWCHGVPVPECFSWYLVKLPNTGAIATIGNTGLGYGILGEDCLIGGFDGGICIEFFKQYGQNGYHVLGDAYGQTLISYINTFDMNEDDHIKSLQQWVLLGDPSLMIGGHS